MKSSWKFLAGAMVILLAACQSAAEGTAQKVSAPNAGLYGDYLAASYAHKIGDAPARQTYFSRAFEQAPDDVRLGRRAMVAAIETGDMRRAAGLANSVYKVDSTEALARALLGVQAFRQGRNQQALDYLAEPSDDLTMNLLMQLVRGWVEVDEGEFKSAREIFSTLGGANYFAAFGQLQIAKLEILEGNFEAAEAALKLLDESGVASVESALTWAQLKAKTGKQDAAIQDLQGILDINDTPFVGPIKTYISRLEAGEDLPNISIKGQAARALTDPSWGFFLRNQSVDGAMLYLRFSRWIEPDYTKSAVWLGSLLDEGDAAEQDQAYALYNGVPKDDPYYVSAQLNVANIYFDQDKDETGIAVLEALNAHAPSLLTRESLGRARFFREDFAEALPFYDDLLSSMSEDDIKKNVDILRSRGIIYERLGRWDEAELDFKKVLDYAPADVETLNYLGYSWVDRGEHLTEAFNMIRKAVELRPQTGAIVDSLGWAHYKLGEYEQAKTELEKAAVLSPSSATIIDHLGDSYWKLGRHREARFQWSRALDFDPTDDEKATIKIKLDSGLDAVSSAP